MRFVRCQDLGYCNCNYIAKAPTDSEAIAQVMLHVKKEHPHLIKQMNLQKILEFKKKIRKNFIYQ
jgi:predicted small metal-binding protein